MLSHNTLKKATPEIMAIKPYFIIPCKKFQPPLIAQ